MQLHPQGVYQTTCFVYVFIVEAKSLVYSLQNTVSLTLVIPSFIKIRIILRLKMEEKLIKKYANTFSRNFVSVFLIVKK